MFQPTFLPYGFAAVMVAVSVYCAVRLVVARRLNRHNHDDVNVAHVVMGVAMVGMFVPRWNVIPNHVWEPVFAVIAVYFIVRGVLSASRRDIGATGGGHGRNVWHYAIHAVMAVAMLYMYALGMPPAGAPSSGMGMSMSGPPAAGDPAVTLLLVAVLLVSAIWQLDAINRHVPVEVAVGVTGGSAPSAGGEGRTPLAPRLEVGCHIAMCLAMGYMLIVMV